MNNSASNNSSTQPSEERRKKWDKTRHEQEIVDELVACGKDNIVRRPTSGFEKSVDIGGVNERFWYESPRKPTLSAVMLLEKT